MTFLSALKRSLFVHALPLILLLIVAGTGGKTGKEAGTAASGSTPDHQTIVEKPSETTEVQVELKEIKLPIKKRPLTKHENQDCTNFFGGVGIEIGFGTSVKTGKLVAFIDQAFPGYPAYEAGLRPLDELLEDYDHIRGEIGTPVKLTYKNASGVHEVTLIRDKICTIEKGAGE